MDDELGSGRVHEVQETPNAPPPKPSPSKPTKPPTKTPPVIDPEPEKPMLKGDMKKSIFGALGNNKLSPESRQVLESMRDGKAFKISAEKYGTAIAETIMVQTDAILSNKVNFEDELKKRIEIKGGSYGLIYKGKTPTRLAPFVWQLDQGTRRSWAVFSFNNFYGHNDPPKWAIWKKFWTILVLTPFDNGSNMVDDYGKGYLVKFDEKTQFQMPMNVQDTLAAEKMRVDNKNFISAALTLWVDLSQYTKPKINMKLVMYLIIAAGIVVFLFWFFKSHPGFLSILHI